MIPKTSIIERLKAFTARLSPPGANTKNEWRLYIIGNIISFTVSLLFFASYASERSKIYDYNRALKKYILNESATMTDFDQIMSGYLVGFIILSVIMLSLIIFRYSYYRQGSQSIYLMKRLPNKNEIHKRAIPLPVLASISCLVYAFVLRVLYFILYVIITPNQCLPAGVWEQLWRLF